MQIPDLTAAGVERYLHDHIPLSAAMGVTVVSVDAGQVRLCAPFAPNINHRSTIFGGSASALAILAGWTMAYVRLHSLPFRKRIVIQRNTVAYLKPIEGDFCAVCTSPPEADWQRLVEMVTRKARGRIVLPAELLAEGISVGTFEGAYVVLRREG